MQHLQENTVCSFFAIQSSSHKYCTCNTHPNGHHHKVYDACFCSLDDMVPVTTQSLVITHTAFCCIATSRTELLVSVL